MIKSECHISFKRHIKDESECFNAKRWDRKSIEDQIKSANPCHDTQVVGLLPGIKPCPPDSAKSEDFTTAPRYLELALIWSLTK